MKDPETSTVKPDEQIVPAQVALIDYLIRGLETVKERAAAPTANEDGATTQWGFCTALYIGSDGGCLLAYVRPT